MKSQFNSVDPSTKLPEVEEKIGHFWDEDKTFQKSLDNRRNAKRYSFYDGPPFATGLPHYGHLVASTMKDTVPRYWTMRGFYVERRWGWDCHGLPIENLAEKELGLQRKKDIVEYGVEKFNDFCRSKVLEYADEWKKIMNRFGRWADMDKPYKTMDLSYMESVWWVFKELYDQKLIYEGYRSIHICPRCETTLSQSEVTEGYKTVKDLSLIAEFKSLDDSKTSFLAWTTTPWTLLGNVALAVGNDISYVKIEKKDEGVGEPVRFILAKDRLNEIFKGSEYQIVEEMKGKDLVGLKYQPLFPFADQKIDNFNNGWQIVAGNFVTTEEGTGIVHIAPAFGEDDLNLGKTLNLPFIQHIGMDGIIKPGYGEFSGLSVKPIGDIQSTDVKIIQYLAKAGLLFDKEQYEHSYPHCWRCDTPLLNYATSSWFVKITDLKPEALELAKKINWVPKHMKTGRFGKWLEGARDWSISRQRFWASVIPIWKCKCGEIRVLGSVKELEDLSGQKITDIHKHVVDEISFSCHKCQGEMKRIPDVLDTWFDSGSMPYAQVHYPFENEEEFNSTFPAEFIAEGADQTRAWFYYLHTLATALKKEVAFKNVVVNGIVLAEDGKKMSKRLQNYPDPVEIFNKYGADVLRFYLLSSPVMSAETINFSEKDVAELSRGFFRMLWNSYSFFVLYANNSGVEPKENYKSDSDNILDQWIMSELKSLTISVNKSMEAYNLSQATRAFLPFVDNLSNWYVRRSRKRFSSFEDNNDKSKALETLGYVLVELSKLLAPFAPFLAEEIYKNLTGLESVHLSNYPSADVANINKDLLQGMKRTREIVEMALSKRNETKIKVRQPLSALSYNGEILSSELEEIIAEEVNVKKVENISSTAENQEINLNTELSDNLIVEGEAREIIRQIQQARKEAGLNISDRISIYLSESDPDLEKVLQPHKNYIMKETLAQDFAIGTLDSATYHSQIKVFSKTYDLYIKANA